MNLNFPCSFSTISDDLCSNKFMVENNQETSLKMLYIHLKYSVTFAQSLSLIKKQKKKAVTLELRFLLKM